eukprot:scaffold1965_cov110-Cylindrotheca_fusiformis.AAC.13
MSCVRNFFAVVVLATGFMLTQGFVSHQNAAKQTIGSSLNVFDKIGEFFEELDAFVDDATSRRLGAGASFYGKRKSNFYGKNDKGRKRDRSMADPTEDYKGPTSSGYFKWMPDETGQLQPVSRMKAKNLSKNLNWEQEYSEQDNKN